MRRIASSGLVQMKLDEPFGGRELVCFHFIVECSTFYQWFQEVNGP
jgi:hypothetical protein